MMLLFEFFLKPFSSVLITRILDFFMFIFYVEPYAFVTDSFVVAMITSIPNTFVHFLNVYI